MEKAKIILVEDNQKIQKELCEFLSRYDYETKALNNFENIVEDILKERADLVLLDINLPVYDGYYICRAVREKSDVPIIVVTSRDSEMDELMEELWQSNEFVDDNTLTVNINRLRKKLDSIGLADYIVTKRGQGYLV